MWVVYIGDMTLVIDN